MNSDSKKPPREFPETNEAPESSLETTNVSGLTTIHSAAAKGLEAAKENAIIKGLKDSVDTTLKDVRSKVDPKDLLYYFGILVTFGVLAVGPFAARYVLRADFD
jgi:hypothetical protein